MFQLHGWEALLFYLLAFSTLILGVFVVTARVAVHSALFLIGTMVNIALMFILLRAEFVAGVQILVYVGGVMVLFLFVIMLIQTRAEEDAQVKLYTGQSSVVLVVAALLAISFYFALMPAQGIFRPGAPETQTISETGESSQAGTGSISKDTQNVGQALYKDAALPFEIASLLLLVAMVGAVTLARGGRQEKSHD
ncbi:MAG TPA: NADH-quinone oxidoreductase subunit J [Blastocatellia bacterium]|nr:NADH-quinone oxidoreductase subunit J [Blastocatellia bacterium]